MRELQAPLNRSNEFVLIRNRFAVGNVELRGHGPQFVDVHMQQLLPIELRYIRRLLSLGLRLRCIKFHFADGFRCVDEQLRGVAA